MYISCEVQLIFIQDEILQSISLMSHLRLLSHPYAYGSKRYMRCRAGRNTSSYWSVSDICCWTDALNIRYPTSVYLKCHACVFDARALGDHPAILLIVVVIFPYSTHDRLRSNSGKVISSDFEFHYPCGVLSVMSWHRSKMTEDGWLHLSLIA